MKKIWHVLLIVVCALCLGLAACGKEETTAIKLSGKALTLKTGATATIEAVLGDDVDFTADDLVWSSSDDKIVTVKGEGLKATVTAVAVGKAKITASYGSMKAECTVTVEKSDLSPISIFLPEGKLVLKAKVEATVKAFSDVELTGTPVWSSSDTTIGTVEGQGLTARVKALKRGECTITVTCDGYSASFTLIVGVS